MKALIDADIVGYRIGFTTQDVPVDIAMWRCTELIERILADTKATEYQLYLTASGDETAFRPIVYPAYKQNRKQPKPLHYNALREFMISEWKADVVSGIEADDAMGIEQSQYPFSTYVEPKTVICTIDKDLNMIPGLHYNFVHGNMFEVLPTESIFFFYKQLLMGDTADNVQGIAGIGEKKASKILEGSETEQELFERTRNAYQNDEEMLRTGEVLWIMRNKDTPWSSTKFGSLLVQKVGIPWQSDMPHQPHSLESIGEEVHKDGFQPSGTDQPDSGEVMAEKHN